MRGRILLISLALSGILPVPGLGQPGVPPSIEWQATFGGTSTEYLQGLQQTSDGGFLLGGFSSSGAGGTKSSPGFGEYDYWVLRLDAGGHQLWDRSFGGSSLDACYVFSQTVQGGVILGGGSRSGPGGNKTSPRFGTGFDTDYWVVCLDADGVKLWEQSFGGDKADDLYGLQQTLDGGFMIGGNSVSGVTGNKTSPGFGPADFWVARLDATGNKLDEFCFGGESSDSLYCMNRTRDGGFILGGVSMSDPGGNKTSPHYGGWSMLDMWCVRIDANGQKLWDQSFGGPGHDVLLSVQETADGGFILGGYSDSAPGGNKTSPHFGSNDFWVVRVDASGNKLWDQSFGGIGEDRMKCLSQTADGGFILGGMSLSGSTGNKTSPNLGDSDFWVVRLDAAGNKLWEQSCGGVREDELHSLQQTSDGGFILGGHSFSPVGGNKTVPNVQSPMIHSDFWLIKLRPDMFRLSPLAQPPARLETNCYRFMLTGPTNAFVVECSTDLQDWTPIQTNAIAGPGLEIMDPSSATAPRRFYRARLASP